MDDVLQVYHEVIRFEYRLKQTYKDIAKKHELTLTFDQWIVFRYITLHPNCLMSTIAQQLQKQKTSVHRIIRTLKALDLIQTNQHQDHLSYQPIHLTSRGESCVEAYHSLEKEIANQFKSSYFDRELEILKSLLKKNNAPEPK